MRLTIFAATGGIGRLLLEQAVDAGHEVTAVARRTQNRSRPVRAVTADLSDPEDRERLVTETISQLGAPDILVSNAAVTYFTPVAEFTARRYRLMFDIQVEAPFHLAQLVLPGMREKCRGWILNISSIAARHPVIPPAAWAGRKRLTSSPA